MPLTARGCLTVVLLMGATLAPTSGAESIYHWVDDRGVHHYTDTPPDEGVGKFRRIEEIPHDAAADAARQERDREFEQRQELEAVQDRLAEAERQAEDASRRAAEAERKADRLAEEVRRQEENDDSRYSVIYPYWWDHRPHYGRPPVRPPWKPPGDRPRPSKPRPPEDRGQPYPFRPYPYAAPSR